MELHTYLAQVRSQLGVAAALGDDRAREIAASLTAAAEPAVQLALVAALSAAADEITAALLDAPGAPSVTARLAGDTGAGVEIHFDVRHEDEGATEPPAPEDTDASARISLRLSEPLKADIESAARRDSVSVNTWLVRAAARTLSLGARGGDRARRNPHSRDAHRITGWING